MTQRTRMETSQRLAQIVAHATDLIAEKGYFGFSLGELAKRCQLSNAGLIHHIGSKEGVLQMVLEERDRRDRQAVGVDDPQPEGPGWTHALAHARPDAGTDLLHRIVAHNATQPTMVRLYAILRSESLAQGHPCHEYFRQRDAEVLRGLEQLLTGHVRDPRSTARAVLALMGGLEEQWLRDLEAMDLVETWDSAYTALLEGSR
ncbi:MAG: TetR/AcrR family transcriptional regulator [Actinomyces urogenitalis]|uniref:TetR/AcrR family transcriptional regulator n=1 Tax=Actinomyces urogenitalis TaxID=103621 RepID=UPI002A840C99|nr:TetR/AcrR family transcriptional regulator [Actinomyces urogenitalis]MDY3678185.1 TetR/AcrR family transcriptional regulator [Actinomyces urogenitalis]